MADGPGAAACRCRSSNPVRIVHVHLRADGGPGRGGTGASASSQVYRSDKPRGKVPVPGGSKPSVLFFFSIECGACGPGARALAEVQNGSPAAANYVAVDIAPYETAEEIKEFLAGNNASALAFASDSGTRLITSYRINQVSTAVVLDAASTEIFRAVEPSAAELQTALAAAGAD